jgi:hypothetical protein
VAEDAGADVGAAEEVELPEAGVQEEVPKTTILIRHENEHSKINTRRIEPTTIGSGATTEKWPKQGLVFPQRPSEKFLVAVRY